MASYKRCPNGHGYDAEKHTFCPHCTPLASPDPIPAQMKTTIAGSESSTPRSPSVRPNKAGVTTVVISGGASTPSATSDYVVGWLVVVNGKGRGRDLRIPPGQCKIGRDKGEITLPFGDNHISRERHAYITYIQKQNSFIIQHGDGKNLVEVNGEPVIGIEMLAPFDRIRLGETDLIFVPLCGNNFDWSKGHIGNTDGRPVPVAVEDEFSQPNGRVKTKLYFEN